MSFEKRWAAISPRLFTANGNSLGQVTLASTENFRVKQEVILNGTSLSSLELEVKRVLSSTVLEVGPPGTITLRSDLSLYTVAAGANIQALEQNRPPIPEKEYSRAMFEEEPVVAERVFPVDELGNPYNDDNPLPVVFSSSGPASNVSIVEGGNTMTVNPDGSINVVPISSSSSTPGLNVQYSEQLVATGSETTIISFTAAGPNGYRLFKVLSSGENVGRITVKLNGSPIAMKRLFWGNFNADFTFEQIENGLKLNPGDILAITAFHNRPIAGNFEATLLGLVL